MRLRVPYSLTLALSQSSIVFDLSRGISGQLITLGPWVDLVRSLRDIPQWENTRPHTCREKLEDGGSVGGNVRLFVCLSTAETGPVRHVAQNGRQRGGRRDTRRRSPGEE